MKILKHDSVYPTPNKALVPTAKTKEFIGELAAQPPQQESVVIGGSATGKLTMTKEFAAQSGRPTATFSGHQACDTTDVQGRFVVEQDGGIAFQESLMKTTAEAGGIIILDSPSLMPGDTQDSVAKLIADNPDAKFIAVMHDDDFIRGGLSEDLAGAFGAQQ